MGSAENTKRMRWVGLSNGSEKKDTRKQSICLLQSPRTELKGLRAGLGSATCLLQTRPHKSVSALDRAESPKQHGVTCYPGCSCKPINI